VYGVATSLVKGVRRTLWARDAADADAVESSTSGRGATWEG
jgi:hypothetical protein